MIYICMWEDGTWCTLDDIDTKDLGTIFKVVELDLDYDNPNMGRIHDLHKGVTNILALLEERN